MKIAPKAIDLFLASCTKDHRAALLFGPDAGLIRERAQRMKQQALAGGDDPFAFTELSEAQLLADPARLADELSAISMLASKRAIWLRDAGDKLTKIIEAAAPYFNPDVFLIVTADELSTRSSLRGWFEKEPLAASVACYKDEVRDVQSVIRKAFDSENIQAEREVIEYLSQQLGNDRYVTYQELEKIITYAGDGKRVSLTDVRALVDYNRDTELDDIVNAVADRNLSALEKTLTLLLREGMSPVVYLRALQRYFNRLYFIRAQMSSGKSVEQVIAGLRPPVFFRAQPIITRHAQNWSSDAIIKALALLASAELACKTSDLPMIPASSRRLLQITQLR